MVQKPIARTGFKKSFQILVLEKRFQLPVPFYDFRRWEARRYTREGSRKVAMNRRTLFHPELKISSGR